MSRSNIKQVCLYGGPSLGELLTTRLSGLSEPECWAILCQAVQALQDLFLSDGASGNLCIPLVTPSTLMLSSRGRVKLCHTSSVFGCGPPAHLTAYLAPEYRPNKRGTDTEMEKMWIYSLGETLKRVTLRNQSSNFCLSNELYQVLIDMTKIQASNRATLMYLLEVISEYTKRRQQNRPFSHIVMDLHQEAMAALEVVSETPWGPPAMPELRPRTINRCDSTSDGIDTISRRWISMTRKRELVPKLTKEASTSMESLPLPSGFLNKPGSIIRPKSMCMLDEKFNYGNALLEERNTRRLRSRKNPVQRAASRLYRAPTAINDNVNFPVRECVGPEFVVRASLPARQISLPDFKGVKKHVTVILLNGQKVDVLCNPNCTTAGQLFEAIIQKEHIEENFMLGLSALIAGDFVFLPSDTRICKAMPNTGNTSATASSTLTLFMRVRFFLPSLRGVRGLQARHLLYLQLRRSILEHQLPCSFTQLIELDGLALQAEFGDYNEREHGARDYFLLEHYVPETMSCAVNDQFLLKQELIKSHTCKKGLSIEKAEEDFIVFAQSLPHYGGHFYTATWILKDGHKDVWLFISPQGINLYEREKSTDNCGPQLYEMFEWRSIQTLCYSKQYLCILPHLKTLHGSKLKKYKLKMDNKKSYFTFRLASLHHQFFLRLRTEYTSLQSLSQQFGIALKDMKNQSNSLCKLESLTNDQATVNAETEFMIKFRASKSTNGSPNSTNKRRTKSIHDFTTLRREELLENKENERPSQGLVLDSGYLAGLGSVINSDKRRGVKMGTKMFSRISRSMEAMNKEDYLEEMSLQSVSFDCSLTEVSAPTNEAYIIDYSIKSATNPIIMPDFHESVNATLLDKLSKFSFSEERHLSSVLLERDTNGSLGIKITEGSDGNVYIQSVIVGGQAHVSGAVLSGDQVVAVNGKNLLGLPYNEALKYLTNTSDKVEFLLARRITSEKSIEKYITENCHDFENFHKYGSKLDVPYHKHIRYEIEPEHENVMVKKELPLNASNLSKSLSKSCHHINFDDRDAIKFQSLERQNKDVAPIALPRSLGLSRKWRGPVKYPVTPVKNWLAQSEDEQVFI